MKNRIIEFLNQCFTIVQGLLSKSGFLLTSKIWNLGRPNHFFVYNKFDYVRVMTLELLCDEITTNKIDGAVAELGVFRGAFASIINEAFPNKKLYLFDTFEGFNPDEEKKDLQSGYYTKHVQDFTKTNEQIVLNKMKYKNNCIIKKGFFPESANGLDENFCFVSIDTDLFDPIYSGLSYFYPRLLSGGYIMIHDYNNFMYSGAKAAVTKYSKENGISIIPLCDGGGSAILAKP